MQRRLNSPKRCTLFSQGVRSIRQRQERQIYIDRQARHITHEWIDRRAAVQGETSFSRDVGQHAPDERQHIRFSYAASNEAIEKGVARMADFIRANTKAKKTA